MAQIIKQITVDVAKRNLFQAIVAKQNDTNSRFLQVAFANEGQPIFIESTSSVVINAERADKTAKSFVGTVNEDGTVTVPLTSWMLELDDFVRCDISIIDSESKKLTSTSFTIEVEAAANPEDIISDDENQDILINLLADIADCKSKCDSAIAFAEETVSIVNDVVSDAKNRVSNALKGTVEGTALVIDDMSPVEHTVNVQVHSKNLIPYPYATKTATISGVTFTDNGDGTVTVSGTAEEDIIYAPINQQTAFLLPAGTYTLSGGLSKSVYLQGKVTEDDSVSVTDTGNGVLVTLIENLHCRFNIRITAGTTVNDTIKPQLEVGTVATEYTPYVNPSAVKLKICDKNLFDGQWELGAINSSTGEKTTNSTSVRTVNYIPVKPHLTYHFSFTDGASYFPYSYDANYNFVAYKGMKKGSFYLNMSDNELYLIIVQYGSITPPANAQIEIGSVGTDYEEYKEFIEYTPSADGTVEGVKSLYPSMTLFADKDNTVITCNYNKDINKVVESLVNAIISLGGNV